MWVFAQYFWKALLHNQCLYCVYGFIIAIFAPMSVDCIHTLPFVIDYNKTLALLNEKEKNSTAPMYCTELDLYEHVRYDVQSLEYTNN